MIVTEKKDLTIIHDFLKNRNSIIIVGCSECAAACQTGGSAQVKEMAENFADKNILATISIEAPCDKRIATRDMRRIQEEMEQADALVALTCGSGVQSLSEVTGKPVIAALDTSFLGMVERLGKFYERCSHCGRCILNDTAELCPVTLCPKGVRNGPCEGIQGTRCEVFTDKECVWHSIYERLKERGQEDLFLRYHEASDWEKLHLPREVIWEKK